ncbi:hypothetical protein HJG60_011300 [Phyllostomus discolor]|uniref:Uncharacterized protein n=1 Tax=Phyllostomus discolor TaxID=89673 RepID=A0A834A7F3_9CHIR|nr:hypothetical protein HJG60_011300 [Phyllostomus discolor]
MALQDEQQIRTASSDNQSLVTANIHSDRLPRSSLQPTALDATALQEKYPIERQEEFKMQVLKDPKCGPTWNGLEEQGGLVGSPGRAQSSSIPTVSSHQHKALGSPCYSHLRRQRASTVYHGILISVCLCLQMPIVAAVALQAQGPCHRMMDILDGKADLFCKLKYPRNVENIRKKCSKFPHSPVVYQCEVGGDRPEENMTEYAGWPVIAGSEMCDKTMMLTFLNDSWHSNCTFKNGRKVEGNDPQLSS